MKGVYYSREILANSDYHQASVQQLRRVFSYFYTLLSFQRHRYRFDRGTEDPCEEEGSSFKSGYDIF